MAGNDNGNRYMKMVLDYKTINPVGLCVDTDRQRLYWYDTEYRTISTSKYDGTDKLLFSSPSRSVLNLAVYMVSSQTHIHTHDSLVVRDSLYCVLD